MDGVLSGRGQTEPLAALAAIALVCTAITLYTGLYGTLFDSVGEERALGSVTAERVWDAIGENGVYDSDDDLRTRIEPATIPQGANLEVTVTYVGDDGRMETAGSATFDARGSVIRTDPPSTAERFERSVPVRIAPGDLKPGTLTVVVWS
ncbi:hypothetical protein HLRTI_001015 [Halorhabdus tiamatea SARL4B]|uniref:Uncharacterized protein n=1 Tax=Halorhabdus tiamatea SARL4B TaxID=1033806 RepID=F7PHU3_9EURY|nr:hypothetical protein [Halorhabdus tiamatea]ERJ06937.1 hypothetical protein HLRTI_001015 [Halorhabdus tiamatea SARL4B]CCQ32362.1 hypothetical protein HTIA_0211 [Halorhabdus tiamatea SARL4B]